MTRFSKCLWSITYAVGVRLSVRKNRNMRQHPGQWLALERVREAEQGRSRFTFWVTVTLGLCLLMFQQWFNRELAEAPALWALEAAPERNRACVWQTGNYFDTPTMWMNSSCKIIKPVPSPVSPADLLSSHLSPAHVWTTSHCKPKGHLGCHRLFSWDMREGCGKTGPCFAIQVGFLSAGQ